MAGRGLHRAEHGEVAAQLLCGLQLLQVVAGRGHQLALRQAGDSCQQLFAAQMHAHAHRVPVRYRG
jgi:hypothetical protein